MEPWRALPPLLLALALARATTPGPKESTPGPEGSPPGPPGSVPPGLRAVGYEEAVAAAVELLNLRAASPYVLRLRDALPRPGWPGDLRRRLELSFTVEETSCRAPGPLTAACKSGWLRAVRWCRGWAFLEQQQPTVQLSCDNVPIAFGRTGTSRLSSIISSIRERFRSFIQCGKIWIRDRLPLQQPSP
ncbi:cathelicidin-B1-like [Colius striatus]|uniref:cathelicidin-B1-like n=1 Tax=Colius striatus TaxID=57412 RepID=UPI002B1D9ECB|nr:cathelicidin-B1-like [Colius striatus]